MPRVLERENHLDDPSHRPPPPYPGMMPLPPNLGAGVTVQITNVVGPPPPGMQPVMQPYPMVPHPQPAHPQPARNPGVMGMIRDDAAQRTLEAVARRGPARVLAYCIGSAAVLMMIALAIMVPFGAAASAVLLAELPLALVAIGSFVVGSRAGHGVSSHHLEQAILRVAADNRGVVRIVALAQATGRPLRECQLAIDAMVAPGHATIDNDEQGTLTYRVPDLEPKRAAIEYEVHAEARRS